MPLVLVRAHAAEHESEKEASSSLLVHR
jgi:hypothetical protein